MTASGASRDFLAFMSAMSAADPKWNMRGPASLGYLAWCQGRISPMTEGPESLPEAEPAAVPAEPAKFDPWYVLGRFFKTWVGSSIHDSSGVEIDLEEPYEAFRLIHAQTAAPTERAAPAEPSVSREDFDKLAAYLKGAKRLLVHLHQSFPEARGHIEEGTGNWFVWGTDRDAAPTPEPVAPAPAVGEARSDLVHSVESSSQHAAALGQMLRPFIGADEFGAATFEWFNGPHKLTMYTIGNPYEMLLKSWGTDINNEMEFVSILDAVQVREAFAWLEGTPPASQPVAPGVVK